jgi:hypothetical protein
VELENENENGIWERGGEEGKERDREREGERKRRKTVRERLCVGGAGEATAERVKRKKKTVCV